LLSNVVKTVYDSLFSVADLSWTLVGLRTVEVVAARSGVRLPAAQRFSSLRAQDRGGWGNPVSAHQVASWRAAAAPDHLE
jgi:hypothetical protein